MITLQMGTSSTLMSRGGGIIIIIICVPNVVRCHGHMPIPQGKKKMHEKSKSKSIVEGTTYQPKWQLLWWLPYRRAPTPRWRCACIGMYCCECHVTRAPGTSYTWEHKPEIRYIWIIGFRIGNRISSPYVMNTLKWRLRYCNLTWSILLSILHSTTTLGNLRNLVCLQL